MPSRASRSLQEWQATGQTKVQARARRAVRQPFYIYVIYIVFTCLLSLLNFSAREIDVPASRCKLVKAEQCVHTSSADQEIFNILDQEI